MKKWIVKMNGMMEFVWHEEFLLPPVEVWLTAVVVSWFAAILSVVAAIILVDAEFEVVAFVLDALVVLPLLDGVLVATLPLDTEEDSDDFIVVLDITFMLMVVELGVPLDVDPELFATVIVIVVAVVVLVWLVVKEMVLIFGEFVLKLFAIVLKFVVLASLIELYDITATIVIMIFKFRKFIFFFKSSFY